MGTRYFKFFLVFVALLFTLGAFAQNYPEPQNPPRIVNDFAGIFSASERDALEQKLRTFNDTTSTQIAIATILDLEGVEPSVYATELAHKWGVGKDDKDNGVLVLVKPKTADSKGEIFIAVGYGLEGVIPDAMSSRIIRNVVIPQFQKGNMYGGINDATDVLMKLASGEYTADKVEGASGASTGQIVLFLVMLLILILGSRAKNKTSHTVGSGSSTSHIPPIFFGPMGGGRSSGGSFGGFGGGGFGGFGGGGFGGGGAGGSW